MTEAVILALVALIGTIAFLSTTIVLVKMILKATPSHFKFETEHGNVEVSFDTKLDE